MGDTAHGVPDAVSPRGGGEWTAAAADTRHVKHQATRARRAGGAGCPVSASKPISLLCSIQDREGEQSGRSPLYGSEAASQDKSVLDETCTPVLGAHS
jgi:hypothetical protein